MLFLLATAGFAQNSGTKQNNGVAEDRFCPLGCTNISNGCTNCTCNTDGSLGSCSPGQQCMSVKLPECTHYDMSYFRDMENESQCMCEDYATGLLTMGPYCQEANCNWRIDGLYILNMNSRNRMCAPQGRIHFEECGYSTNGTKSNECTVGNPECQWEMTPDGVVKNVASQECICKSSDPNRPIVSLSYNCAQLECYWQGHATCQKADFESKCWYEVERIYGSQNVPSLNQEFADYGMITRDKNGVNQTPMDRAQIQKWLHDNDPAQRCPLPCSTDSCAALNSNPNCEMIVNAMYNVANNNTTSYGEIQERSGIPVGADVSYHQAYYNTAVPNSMCPEPCPQTDCMTALPDTSCGRQVKLLQQTSNYQKNEEEYFLKGLPAHSDAATIQLYLSIHEPQWKCPKPCPSSLFQCSKPTIGSPCWNAVEYLYNEENYNKYMYTYQANGLPPFSDKFTIQQYLHEFEPEKKCPLPCAYQRCAQPSAQCLNQIDDVKKDMNRNPQVWTHREIYATSRNLNWVIQQWLSENEPLSQCSEPCPICSLPVNYECSGVSEPFSYFYASSCAPFNYNNNCVTDSELIHGVCACERLCAAAAMCSVWEWSWDNNNQVYTCHMFKGSDINPKTCEFTGWGYISTRGCRNFKLDGAQRGSFNGYYQETFEANKGSDKDTRVWLRKKDEGEGGGLGQTYQERFTFDADSQQWTFSDGTNCMEKSHGFGVGPHTGDDIYRWDKKCSSNPNKTHEEYTLSFTCDEEIIEDGLLNNGLDCYLNCDNQSGLCENFCGKGNSCCQLSDYRTTDDSICMNQPESKFGGRTGRDQYTCIDTSSSSGASKKSNAVVAVFTVLLVVLALLFAGWLFFKHRRMQAEVGFTKMDDTMQGAVQFTDRGAGGQGGYKAPDMGTNDVTVR